MGRPNDQLLTPAVFQIPVTVRIAPGFATLKMHAGAVVCFGGDPWSVPYTPGTSKSPEIGLSARSRARFAWLAGEFHARRHARSYGCARDAASVVPATTSANDARVATTDSRLMHAK